MEGLKECCGTDARDEHSQYGNTKRASEYSTENFKVELTNLPIKLNFAVLKNLLEKKFKVVPHKIRSGRCTAFLAFKDEHERDDAINKLNGQEWRGRNLIARIATARDDPLARKRMLVDEARSHSGSLNVESEQPIADDDINERICPLISKSYEEQLEFKASLVKKVLNMSKEVQRFSRTLNKDAPELFKWTTRHTKICCQFDGVIASPVLKGYRNKCEFSIGRGGEIGFKIGQYRSGSDRICRPPNGCPLLTETMFNLIDLFSDHLKNSSNLKGFDMVTHEGHFRQLTIKCNTKNEYLLIIDLNPQDLTQEELDAAVNQTVQLFKQIEEVVSIYFIISQQGSSSNKQQSLRLAHGQDCLYETLNIDIDRPLKFRIGPSSFFQVNSRAAELLYRSIIEVAGLGPTSMVLDVGCGTGTISLSLANKVNHVIGIEVVPQAIEDAKANALNNNIENVTFYAGRAEDLIGETISILKGKMDYQKIEGDIVAVVDPPRAGFTNSFIKTIRASSIRRVVYIACDPKSNTNLLTLCRPASKQYQGEPFVPVRAKAFDLFPHTKCCELLIVYERLSMLNDQEIVE